MNLALARENLKDRNVILKPVGLGDKEKKLRIYHSPQFGFAASSSQKTRDHNEEFEDVEIKAAYPELAGLGPISILKIDTEGHELPIIQSIRPLLPSISLLFLEVHSDLHRVYLDALLYEQFTLFFSRSEMAHRYCLAYVNKEALANHTVQIVAAPELLVA